ncbi:hypothetical protein C8R44DRAFT_823533, partial [Mycena epipterygia]
MRRPLPSGPDHCDATSIANLGTMREAAESVETGDLDPRIGAASGTAGGSRFVLLPPHPSSCSILRFHVCST